MLANFEKMLALKRKDGNWSLLNESDLPMFLSLLKALKFPIPKPCGNPPKLNVPLGRLWKSQCWIANVLLPSFHHTHSCSSFTRGNLIGG